MPITFVSSTEQSTNNDPTPLSMTVDIGTRTNGLLVVAVITFDTATHTLGTATWAGANMSAGPTRIRETITGVFRRVAIFYLSNPTNGSNTFSVPFTDGAGNSANNSYLVPLWVDGAHQTQASVLDQTASNEGSTDPSLDLTPTENGELLVMVYASEADAVLAVGSGETLVQDVDLGTRVQGVSYAIQTTATTQSMNWTGVDDVWLAVAASFKAVPVGGTPPTVALDTADASELSSTPTLAFTGTSDAQPIRYNVQISSSPTFSTTPALVDSHNEGALGLHPNPTGTTTWTGKGQVDDRFYQSITAGGNFLHQAKTLIDMDAETDGHVVARIYAHQGTFGTSSEPLDAADAANTPTPGWLAESAPVALDTGSTDGWHTFAFSGDQRIYLEDGAHYVLAFDWWPNLANAVYLNTIVMKGDTTPSHAGNAYIDGSSVNNGIRSDFDVNFELWEQATLLDKVSGTDSGFTGTPDSSDPFTSGQQVTFTVQAGDELVESVPYYWRVRGIDPAGTNTYGDWTAARTFTVEPSATYTLAASMGFLTLTGIDSALLVERTVTAAAGSFVLTGVDATLEYTPGGMGPDYTLSAETGTFTLTGQATALLVGHLLNAAGGTFTLTGQDASLQFGLTLNAETGAYTLSGQDITFTLTHVLAAASGSYTLTGIAATLTWSAYEIPPTPDERTYTVVYENRTYTVPAEIRVYSLS